MIPFQCLSSGMDAAIASSVTRATYEINQVRSKPKFRSKERPTRLSPILLQRIIPQENDAPPQEFSGVNVRWPMVGSSISVSPEREAGRWRITDNRCVKET